MPDLIHLAIPAFILLMIGKAIAGAVLRRDLYEFSDAAASIWDKLFGSFEPENPADPSRFGFTKNIETYNALCIAFHEWFDLFCDAWHAKGWRNKMLYVFGNPGWRHDAMGTHRS